MTFFNEILHNRILWVSIISWFAAQAIKMLIEFMKGKGVNLRLLTSSGGMPSSHTAFVTAMTTGVGIQRGFHSTLFAITAVMSMIVMYDAIGVRYAVGKQAESINMLITSLNNQDIQIEQNIKKVRGHRPIEVFAGWLLGILSACLFFNHFLYFL